MEESTFPGFKTPVLPKIKISKRINISRVQIINILKSYFEVRELSLSCRCISKLMRICTCDPLGKE
jgi:hypothetical protein